MKIVKHYWFVAIALITMISFSSCESDEERGFDISGLYGKTWWGEMGFEDLATFSRFFKKMNKESLSKYRKREKRE